MKYTEEEKLYLELGKRIGIYEKENGEIEFDLEQLNEIKNNDDIAPAFLKYFIDFDKIEDFYLKVKGVPLDQDINKNILSSNNKYEDEAFKELFDMLKEDDIIKQDGTIDIDKLKPKMDLMTMKSIRSSYYEPEDIIMSLPSDEDEKL